MLAQELTSPFGILKELNSPTKKCLSFTRLQYIFNSNFNTGVWRGQITMIPTEGWLNAQPQERGVNSDL